MFTEFIEAASFVALYAGLRICLLNLNSQAALQPIAFLVVLAANGLLRDGFLRPLGVQWAGLPEGFREWGAVILFVFTLLPAALFLALLRLRPAFAEYLENYLGGLGTMDFSRFVPFALAFTFVEEAIARGYLQTRIAAVFGTRSGIIIASAFFAWAHWTPGRDSPEARAHVCAGFAAGTLLGWMYASTDNLLVPWIAHAAWDISLAAAMSLFGSRSRALVGAGHSIPRGSNQKSGLECKNPAAFYGERGPAHGCAAHAKRSAPGTPTRTRADKPRAAFHIE